MLDNLPVARYVTHIFNAGAYRNMKKNHIPTKLAPLLVLSCLYSAPTHAKECDDKYFAINSYGQEFPVKSPVKKLAETLQKANAIDPAR
jgi:hypothetical protein